MVKSLGADHVLDYTKEDFSAREERYDVIFDTVAKFPKSKTSKALGPNGIYVRSQSWTRKKVWKIWSSSKS
jgi:NADPH:quinone reductase-like Zn-dependent oxidoreductase